MAHNRRLCRRSARSTGRSDEYNYVSDKAYKYAKMRRKLAKQGRKNARK